MASPRGPTEQGTPFLSRLINMAGLRPGAPLQQPPTTSRWLTCSLHLIIRTTFVQKLGFISKDGVGLIPFGRGGPFHGGGGVTC